METLTVFYKEKAKAYLEKAKTLLQSMEDHATDNKKIQEEIENEKKKNGWS